MGAGHGLTDVLWMFVVFAGTVLLITGLIDLGSGRTRLWISQVAARIGRVIARGHDRVVTFRPR
jgi:hypothetical protein